MQYIYIIRARWAVAAALFLFLLHCSLAAAATVALNPSVEHQTMDGFGASVAFNEYSLVNLPEPKRSQALDLLFRDLGATILRLRINAFFERANDNPDPFDTDLASFNWAVNADARTVALEALSRGLINTVWAACWSPPGWMKDNGSEKDGGRVLPSMYDEFAEFLYAYLAGMNQLYSIPVTMVSPFNEPGFKTSYESTETNPAEYRDILKVVGQRFVDEGMGHVSLIGPDTINPNHPTSGANAFLDTILADPLAAAFLSIGATHQYGESGSFNWPGFYTRCQSNSMHAWQSEMSKLSAADQGISGALEIAWWMWITLTQGNCSSWQHWSYFWPYEPDKAQGLIGITGRPPSDFTVPKRYYVFKQFSRSVRPGSIRIHATSDNPDLFVIAFKRPDQLVLVAFNRTTSSIPAAFSVPGAIGSAVHIRTSAAEDYSRLADIPVSGDSFNADIIAESISTFILPISPSPGGSFSLKDSVGTNLAAFTTTGNLYLKGSLTQFASPQETGRPQFIVKTSTGTILLALDQAGNMGIAGSAYPAQPVLLPTSSAELIVKDSSGNVAAVLNSSGDLYLRGYVWTGLSL